MIAWSQMYKVFFNNKCVLLVENYDLGRIRTGEFFIRYGDFEEIDYLLNLLEKSSLINILIIESENIEDLWSDFRAHFREIDAAGGLVLNDRKELLLIHRNDLWDLPKGKWEEGETIAECAVREVEEECGITDLIRKEHLMESYHTYRIKGFRILKKTDWFIMKSNQENFTPQTEEGIDQIKWVNPKTIDWEAHPTYASIKMVIADFLRTTGRL